MRLLRLWALRGRRIRFLERCIEQIRQGKISDRDFFDKEINRIKSMYERTLRDMAEPIRYVSEVESEQARLRTELQEWKDRAALYYSSWKAGIKDEVV